MIHLERTSPPAFLLSDKVKKAKQNLFDFYSDPNNSQNRANFELSIYKSKEVKKALLELSNGKCAYCESSLKVTAHVDIEHFRPKSIYWWLAYEWENLIPVCQICNMMKKTTFGVENKLNINSLIGKNIQELNSLEKPLLLDPCIDYPEEYFDYKIDNQNKNVFILPVKNSKRGNYTIETLGLNRPELKQLRYSEYNIFKTFTDVYDNNSVDAQLKNQILRQLSKMISDNVGYTGVLRNQLLKIENNNFEDLKDLFDINRYPKKKVMVVENIHTFNSFEIEIKNIKSINNLQFSLRTIEDNKKELNNYRESWLLILGENGVGKSSVLQAIILALLPDKLRKKYWDNRILKKGEKEGFVNLNFENGIKIKMTFNNKGIAKSNLGTYNDYLIAYGATRLLPKGNLLPEANDSKIKVHNFFDYSIALQDAEKWLLELPDVIDLNNVEEIKKGTFDKAALFVKDLLFLGENENLTRKDGKIYVFKENTDIELGLLSDGYKTLFALAMDLYIAFRMQQTDIRYEDVGQFATGLVLIDEIGTHLHPRWKMKIVEQLRKALPNVFFIVTTHEPLCLRGLRNKEVIVLKRDNDNVFSVENLESPEGLRVDQILTSKYFGLNTTIDPILEDKYNRYYKLLAKNEDNRTPKENKEIGDLQEELKVLKQLGYNLREELFYFVIDEVIAKDRERGFPAKKIDLKNEVKEKIKDLIEIIDSELGI